MTREQAFARAFLRALVVHRTTTMAGLQATARLVDVAWPMFTFTVRGSR